MNWKVALLAVIGFLIIVGAIAMAGVSPVAAGQKLFDGTLGSSSAFSGTLRETTPLLFAGVAVFLALRAGLFNIGVEGQLVMGAVTSAFIALNISGAFGMALAVIGGIFAGALWALPAGLIKAYRGGHEVITTIMLNNVAGFLTTALVAGPLKAPGQESTTTSTLPQSSMLPFLWNIDALRVSSALILALLIVFALGFWLRRAVSGFELQLVGANSRAAELAGVDRQRTIVSAMVLSGAIGGLAGAVQVLAYEGRFFSGFSPGYGFDALGVALLAGSSSAGILPAALLFGILAKGGTSLQILQVPKGITYVVLGFLILVFAAIRYRRAQAVD